jgi:tetratricopeptide (TPR) repeat protein
MACLDERLHYLQATVDELTRVDAGTVVGAVQVTAKLPGLGACARAEVLAKEPLLPTDPALAAEVSELNRTLITGRTKVIAGRFDESLALAEEVVVAATALDYEPLLARAWLLRGAAHERSGHYDDAVADLERALESALALNMREESAYAASDLVYVVGYQRAEFEEAQRWIPLARALSRAAESQRSRVRYLTHAGTVAYAGGAYEEARSLWEEALGLVQRSPKLDELDLSPILANLGALARHQGRYAAAREYQARVLAITESELGPEHPEMAEALGDLGSIEIAAGSPAEGRDPLERALALATTALGPDHPRLAIYLSNLALIASAQLRYADARGYLERALAIDEATLGPEHPDLAIGHNSLGKVALGEGKREEAREHYGRALSIRERALGPDHPGLIYPLANLGELALLSGDAEGALREFRRAQRIAEGSLEADDPLAAKLSTSLGRTLLEVGDPAAAIGHLERALEIQSEGEVGEVDLADTRFAVARALWELPPGAGRDRSRAVAVAKLSLPAWEGDGERSSAKLRELRVWLEEHVYPDR